MKKIMRGLVLSLTLVASANASERVSAESLQQMGLSGMKIVSDAEGEAIRGKGFKGHGHGHFKHGVTSGINFGIIGGGTVIVNITNSKNVRIGSHNHLKFK